MRVAPGRVADYPGTIAARGEATVENKRIKLERQEAKVAREAEKRSAAEDAERGGASKKKNRV